MATHEHDIEDSHCAGIHCRPFDATDRRVYLAAEEEKFAPFPRVFRVESHGTE